ncbi:MAG: GAF domain-containing SpoIIE family protein phosphatase [Spirochaetota bacterium]
MILYVTKIFIVIAAVILLLVEEMRQNSLTNKKLILFAGLILLKELGTLGLHFYFGEALVTDYFFYQYILFWIPPLVLFYTVLQHIVGGRRFFMVPGILLGLMFFCSAVLFQFQDFVGDYLFLVLIGVRSIFLIAVIYILVRINTVYIGDRRGVLVSSIPVINVIVVLYSINFLIIASPMSTFHSIMDAIAYGAVFLLFYRKNQYGYQELSGTIKEYEKELNSILNLMNKSGVGAGNVNDFNEITDSILQYVCEMINARSGILLTTTSDKNYLLPRGFYGVFPPLGAGESYASIKKQYLEEFNRQVKLKVGEKYIGKVAQSRQSSFYRNAREFPELVEQSKTIEIETLMAHPLEYKNELLGVIAFCNKEDGSLFTEEDFTLSKVLAEHVAIIMNNFRFYNELVKRQRDERELEIAGTIQKNLLPRSIPESEYVEIFTFNRPAKDVGGDYYNIINVDDKRLDVVIADVAGKGVPASLVMVMISTVLKNIIKANYGPRRIIAFLNRFLCKESTMERYATLSYVSIQVMENILQFTNSGHSPLIVYKSATRNFEQLDTPGIPLGIDADQNYIQKQTEFEPGDIIALFTDGVTEAMNEQNDMFGLDRLCSAIKENCEKDAETIGSTILEQIEMFSAGAEQHDDMSLIIVKKL